MLLALRPYLKLTQMMVQDVLIYRADYVSRFITLAARFAVSAYLWIAIIQSKGEAVAGYDVPAVLTYFLLMQIVGGFSFSNAGFRFASDIQSGELSKYLALPISYIGRQISINLGRNTFYFFSNMGIYALIAAAFWSHFDFNFHTAYIVPAVYALFLGFFLNFCCVCMVGMLAFWITSSNRLIYLYYAIITLLSGTIFPLDVFPPIMQKILDWTIFPYLFYLPIKIIQADTWIFTQSLLIGTAYTILFLTLLFTMYRIGLRKYEAVGN